MVTTIELLVERLIEDEAFRTSFYGNPAAAVATAGLSATPSEITAVLSLRSAYFAEFARALPARTVDRIGPAWSAVRLVRRH